MALNSFLENAANQELPQMMRAEWTELGKVQLWTGNTAMNLFFLTMVLMFLVRAAQ